MSQDIATPETLEQLADDHAAQGMLISSATFRAMAKAWKATEKALADAQAENSKLAATSDRLSAENKRLENVLYQSGKRAFAVEQAAVSLSNSIVDAGFARDVPQGSHA